MRTSLSTLLLLSFAFAKLASAQIIYLEAPSAGAYVNQQGFTYNGATIDWSLNLPSNTGFFVQAFADFGDLQVDFGEWNGAPFLLTATALTAGASVGDANPSVGQLHLSDANAAITEQFYGISYDLGAGSISYGWIKLSTNSSAARIEGIAFNTVAGSAILAGQTSAVPEPASTALWLAAAGLGLAVQRRRRISAIA